MTQVVNGETGGPPLDGRKLEKLFEAMARLDAKKAAIFADVRSIKEEAELLGLSRTGFMRNYKRSQLSPEERQTEEMEDATIARSLGWGDLAAQGRVDEKGQASLLQAEPAKPKGKRAQKANGRAHKNGNANGHAKPKQARKRRDKQEPLREAALQAAHDMPENVTKLDS